MPVVETHSLNEESEPNMVSSTKTLTVSYGTFSCTAEGFEDPLSIVKEAAAFFHGMVQEDRFFGSEPPRLDDALTERFRRTGIDAEQTPNGLTLRPATEAAPDPNAEPPEDAEADLADLAALDGLPAPDAPPPGRDEDDLAPPADELAAEENWRDSAPVAPAGPAPKDDRIDARLDRIRALVRQTQTRSGSHSPAAGEQSPKAPAPDASGVTLDTQDDAAATRADDESRDEAAFTATPEAATTASEIRTRVLKIQRSDFEEALATGRFDAFPAEEELEEEEPEEVTPGAQGTLTPEEEAELARELDAVRAELAEDWDDGSTDEVTMGSSTMIGQPNPVDLAANHGGHADTTRPEELAERLARDNMRKTVKLPGRGRAMLTEGSVDDGDNTSRLLDETNREMAEPEGNRRRSAIAHLRAAVAATRADRLLGRKPDEAKQAEPYREDLATVVRPRRANPPVHNPLERPVVASVWRAEGTPLKLVAEQQVAPPRTDAPLRPRDVSPADTDTPDTPDAQAETPDTGFAEYAKKVGARTLSERLEAAAAYISFVEGRDQFSRPQLMAMLRLADTEESNREDRLRSFGQLLREGKIEKTRGGRFTASDRIGFKPPQAAAG